MSLNSFSQSGIDSSEQLLINGIKQVVKLEAKDTTRPLFLFITGGPGSEGIYPENDKYLSSLKKHFIVVTWDQRNCGQTLVLNPSPVKLSVQLYENDTYELASTLLKQFHRQKLFIMGWSWGTVLGFYMADKHPEMLYAYMAVSPAVNQWESERMSLLELRRKAVLQHNATALNELGQVQIPFQNGLQNYYHRKWLALLNGETIDDSIQFRNYFTQNSDMITLFRKANDINLEKTVKSIHCPVYFFVGRNDHQTNFMISERYYQSLKAPKKNLFWFEKSGHLIPVTEPDLMQQVVVENILPDIKAKW